MPTKKDQKQTPPSSERVELKAQDLRLLASEVTKSCLAGEDFNKAFDQAVARLSASGAITPARGA